MRTQMAHIRPRSTFAVRFLDSMMPILAKFKRSRLQLASVAEQADLSLTWSKPPKKFSRDVAQIV